MAEKRYCIICGDEIHSIDPTADRCPKHSGPQPAQSPMPQNFEKRRQQGHDNSPSLPQEIETWQPGQVILDIYEVKSKLGEGGFGQVYRVHHTGWNMDLAVKRPRADKFKSEKQKQDFVREAETWVDLGLHPHITSCLYVRTIDDVPHVFAECVEGGSLESWIQQGKKGKLYEGDPKEVIKRILDIAIQFAWGLGYAHEHKKKLIHRDVKPDNALMTPDGILKVTDFGLARSKGLSPDGETQDPSGNIKVSGKVYGPMHCSPEQVAGTELSIKTDIWSWGVSVLEMFNGKITWAGGQIADSALESYLRRGGEPHIPPMPESLAELLRECLQRLPDNRPADMLTITEKLMDIYHQEIGQAYPREQPEPAELKADSLNNKALTMLDLGKPKQAEELLDQAVAADSQHVDATYNLGLLRWRSGRIADVDVLESLEQIQQDQPEDSGVASALGWVCVESGRFGKALAYFEQANRQREDSDSEKGLELARPLSETNTGECLHTFKGHRECVRSIAISPDGREILSGSDDGRLMLWDLAAGHCIRNIEGHQFGVTSAVFSPDGRKILSGSLDETLNLRDLAKGEYMHTFEGHIEVWSVALSPDGREILSGSADETLKLWDQATGECLRTLEGHEGDVFAVAISPDGRQALSGSGDNTLKLWDLTAGQCLHTFEGHTSSVYFVVFSADGRQALSGSGDTTLKLWDLVTGQCLHTFEGHQLSVDSAVFSPDGREIISGSADKTLKLWETSTGRCLRTFEGHEADITSIAISPNGCQALSGSEDQTLKLWDLSWLEENQYIAPLRYAKGVTGSEATKREHTHAAFMQLALKDLEKGRISDVLVSLKQARGIPGFERNIETLALCARVECKACITGYRGGWLTRTFNGHNYYVNTVTISPEGLYLLSGSWDRTLKLWDTATGRCLRTFEGHEGIVNSVVFNSDGRQILSGSADKTLKLWETSTGRCLRTYEGHTNEVFSVAINLDGRKMLSGSRDETLKLWDIATGCCMHTFTGHNNYVFSVIFSPDEYHVLSGSGDKTLKLWEMITEKCVRTFKGHTDVVSSIAFSPDGRKILSGSWDKTIKLWDLASGRCMRTFEGHTDGVSSVAISSDGYKILSGGWDKMLKLWDLATGRCLRTFEGHEGSVDSVAISQDMKQVLSGSGDKTLKLWDLDWEYDFPGWTDWDEGARPYIETFLTLHTPFAGQLPQDREPTDVEIRRALTRSGKPAWTEADFQKLLTELGYRGYGWLRPEGVRRKLDEMAAEKGLR